MTGGINETIEDVITALNFKADRDLQNITAGQADIIIEYQVNVDGSWYRLWKSGWLEQGARIEESGINSVSIVFPRPFSDVPTLLTSVESTVRTSYLDNSIDVRSLTSTGFTKQYTANVGTGWAWYACGQAEVPVIQSAEDTENTENIESDTQEDSGYTYKAWRIEEVK